MPTQRIPITCITMGSSHSARRVDQREMRNTAMNVALAIQRETGATLVTDEFGDAFGGAPVLLHKSNFLMRSNRSMYGVDMPKFSREYLVVSKEDGVVSLNNYEGPAGVGWRSIRLAKAKAVLHRLN
jgi:hypothetical protein